MEAAVLRTLELTFRCNKIRKVRRQRASTVDIWFRLARQSYSSGFISENAIPTFLSGEVLDIFKAAVIIHRYKWEVSQVLMHHVSQHVVRGHRRGFCRAESTFHASSFLILPDLSTTNR